VPKWVECLRFVYIAAKHDLHITDLISLEIESNL